MKYFRPAYVVTYFSNAVLVRHSQRKRGATDRSFLRGAAPVLDPTDLASGIFFLKPTVPSMPLIEEEQFYGLRQSVPSTLPFFPTQLKL